MPSRSQLSDAAAAQLARRRSCTEICAQRSCSAAQRCKWQQTLALTALRRATLRSSCWWCLRNSHCALLSARDLAASCCWRLHAQHVAALLIACKGKSVSVTTCLTCWRGADLEFGAHGLLGNSTSQRCVLFTVQVASFAAGALRRLTVTGAAGLRVSTAPSPPQAAACRAGNVVCGAGMRSPSLFRGDSPNEGFES